MNISPINTLGDWVTIRRHIDERVEALRVDLETEQAIEPTQHLRGQIASLRALVLHFDPPLPPPQIKDTDTYG